MWVVCGMGTCRGRFEDTVRRHEELRNKRKDIKMIEMYSQMENHLSQTASTHSSLSINHAPIINTEELTILVNKILSSLFTFLCFVSLSLELLLSQLGSRILPLLPTLLTLLQENLTFV